MDPELKRLFAELNTTFANFKDKQDGRLRDLEAKLALVENARARVDLGGSSSASLHRPEARKAFIDFLRGGDPMQMLQFIRPDISERVHDGGTEHRLAPPGRAGRNHREVGARLLAFAQVGAHLHRGKDIVDFLTKDRSGTSGWVGETDARSSTNPDLLNKVSIPLGEIFANVP